MPYTVFLIMPDFSYFSHQKVINFANTGITHASDVDECTMTCFESENRICSNKIGSYECDCKEGYHQENETSKICEGWLIVSNYCYKRINLKVRL